MAKPVKPPPPPRGIPPGKLNMLANRLSKLTTLGKTEWGDLADQIRDSADRNDSAGLDKALENLGAAYAFLAALASDFQTLAASVSGQLGALNGRMNSLEARVTALERRP